MMADAIDDMKDDAIDDAKDAEMANPADAMDAEMDDLADAEAAVRRAAQRIAPSERDRQRREAKADSDDEGEDAKLAPILVPADEDEAAAPGIGVRARRLAKLRGMGVGHKTVDPTDGKPWRLAMHRENAYQNTHRLDDPGAPNPPRFKGNLHLPQATMLHAMLELEKNPFLRIRPKLASLTGESKGILIQADLSGITLEALGFGKTVNVLALVTASPRPRDLPKPMNVLVIPGQNVAEINCSQQASKGTLFHQGGHGFLPELTVRYSRILPLTVVAAAGAVISQSG